jgi:hypothetical protein
VCVSVTPASQENAVLRFLNEAISINENRPAFKSSGAYLASTLANINAYFHPAIVMCEFEDWDGTPYETAPPFYEGATEKAGELVLAMSREKMAIKHAVLALAPHLGLHTVTPVREYFASLYTTDVADDSTMASALRTNAGYKGLMHSMRRCTSGGFVPNWQGRYLTEDIPFGQSRSVLE